MMKFTQVPSDTWSKLQMNAGILAEGFTPATGTVGTLIGATTGGITFNSNPTYTDFGEDVDNVPANTYQLKRIESYDPVISGTFVTVSAALAASLTGGADVDTANTAHVVPREELEAADFDDVWFIGDYSDVNTGSTAGFLAIHIMNAMNTAGFQIKSTKNGKGNFSFEYQIGRAHV